jgi:pimeloyl-ACP methyl ester carboxylesterase/DNA-binding CsgD family transcriptional regulator
MRQRIGFLRVGGSRVAYATAGVGPPLIFPPAPFSHLDLELESDPIRTFFETLADSFTLVRYDRLGTGLSDRARAEETMTLEFEVDVLEALVAEVADQRVTLFGASYGAAVATGFAARRPEWVKRLLLYGGYADGSAVLAPALLHSMNSLLRADWDLGSRLLAMAFVPEADRELGTAFAHLQAASCDGGMAASLLELSARTDVREVLGQVTAPTLVLHRNDDPVIPVSLGRDVAALVPGARFELLEGGGHPPWLGDTSAVLRAASTFLGFPAPPLARETRPERSAASLTARERDVLRLVAEGLNDATIAQRLVLSAHTVHRHVANIRGRLGQPSRAAAAAHATRLGLI